MGSGKGTQPPGGGPVLLKSNCGIYKAQSRSLYKNTTDFQVVTALNLNQNLAVPMRVAGLAC